MPLLGRKKHEEYMVILDNGQETWTEYVLSPSLERAAWDAFKLSKDRHAILKDVIKTDDT